MARRTQSARSTRRNLPLQLKRMAAEQAAAVLAHLDGAREGKDIEELHRMRVATRRLRETLLLLSPYGATDAYERARKRVRRLTRALGPVRALDVDLALLQAVRKVEPLPEVGYRHAREHLRRRRTQARADMLSRLEPVTKRWLRKRLDAFLDTIDVGLGAEPFVRTLRERHDDFLRELGRVTPRTSKARLHRVRVSTKRYRYALETADAGGVLQGGARIRLCKAIQDAIGRAHDYHVLHEDLVRWRRESGRKLAPSGTEGMAAVLAAVASREVAAWRDVRSRLPAWRSEMRALGLGPCDGERARASAS